MRIGIAGITGRMGRLLAEEVAAAGADLAGGTSRDGSGGFTDIAALASASDGVIDFTNAALAQGHAKALAASGKPWVLGTSGLSEADEAAVAAAAERIPVVYAANFASGVNLVLALAERMAAALPAAEYDAEIVEMHHRQKVDAPSGTAIGMGRAVAKGRGQVLADVMESGRHGHTGAAQAGRDRLCRPARRAGGGRAQPDLRRRRRAYRADPSRLRSPGVRRRRGTGGAVGAGPSGRALFDDGRAGNVRLRQGPP